MKKGIIFILAVMLSYGLFAQQTKNLRYHDQRPLHFGFTVGLNYMDFTIQKTSLFLNDTVDFYSIENKIGPGFHLGPIVNFRLGNYFDVRFLINLSFGQRDVIYKIANDVQGDGTGMYTEKIMNLPSTFVEAPLLIKYKAARINNVRPYLIGGVNLKYDMAARKKPKESEMPKIQLKEFDFYGEAGFGIDWYLEYFKLSTELKFSYGFLDILEKDGTIYTSTIEKMQSKMFMFSFHFEGP